MLAACYVTVVSPVAVSARPSFLDVDDPFNLQAKSTAGGYRDDAPIPRTKAALLAQERDGAEQQPAALPLAHRDDNTRTAPPVSPQSSGAVSIAGSSRDKENSRQPPVGPRHFHKSQPLRPTRRAARPRNDSVDGDKRSMVEAAECIVGSDAVATADGPQSSALSTLSAQQLPHIAPLLDDGVLCGLSSKSWMECVASIEKVRAAAESYRCEDRSDKLRAGVVVLCATPGLGCSNQAVWKAASEACQSLLLAAPFTLPVSLIRVVVPVLLAKLTDKRPAAAAGRLLLHFAESSSARLVQRRVAECVDERCKNARLVEHALLFLASLVASFSLPALSVPPLLSLARCHSSHPQQTVRAAVCCLLSSVYEQLGPSFRLSLASCAAPLLQPSLNAALDEVDASGSARQQPGSDSALMRGRGEDSALVSVSLDALYPRVELCSKLDSGVIGGMRDVQWKVRQHAIQQLTATLEQLQHRVTMKDGGALIAGLVPLLSDSNKLLAAQAMSALRQLICDVGEGMGRWRDKLVPAVLAGVVDAKKAVREQSVAALQDWAGRMGVASIVRLVAKALESANSSGRSALLELLIAHRTQEAEWGELVPATLDCLCDKSGEVRAAADRLTEALVAHCGYNAVNAALHRLKEAYVLQLQPTLDRHRHAKRERATEDRSQTNQRALNSHTTHDNSNNSSSSNEGKQHNTHSHDRTQQHDSLAGEHQAPTGSLHRSATQPAEDESGNTRKANSGKNKAGAHNTRREQQQSGAAQAQHKCQGEEGVSAGGSAAVAAPLLVDSCPADCHPFLARVDIAAKQRRLLRDGKRLQNGSFREWSSEEREETAHTLAALVSPTLHAQLTSADFTRLLHAVHFFTEQLSVHAEAVHVIADVLLRWVSALMGEASPKLLMAVLAFLSSLFASYASRQQVFSEAEMHNVLPFVIERLLGHNVQRVRRDASALLLTLATRGLFPRAKLISALLQGVDSKNKRVVAESCECVGQLWGAAHSAAASNVTTARTAPSEVQLPVWHEMKRGLPQLALLLSSACDPTVRMSALSAIVSAHTAIGEQLWVVLSGHSGKPLPEKALSMIEERVKRTRMDSSSQQQTGPSHDNCALAPAAAPSSSASLTLTPVKRGAAVQRTPLSSAPFPAMDSPASEVRRPKVRKQSNAPTLSALNSSLASLEAMHYTLAAQQTTNNEQAAPTAATTHVATAAAASTIACTATTVPSLIVTLSTGGKSEQIHALVGLSAAVAPPAVCDLLASHVNCVLAAVARSVRSRAVTAPDRRAILLLSRQLCANRPCMDSARSELTSDLCHALLASTADELQGGGTVDDTREEVNYCVQAALEWRSTMEQLTLLASILHASLIASSPYLCSLVTPFLVRWSSVRRLHCEAGSVDVSCLLSWLHRLLTAVRSCDACERCVVDCLDQLLLAAYECSGSEQRLLALLSGYPLESPLVARMNALRQQPMQRTEGRSEQVETAAMAATVSAPSPDTTATGSVRLDQLLSQHTSAADRSSVSASSTVAAVSSSPAAVGLSYVDRFHALQQRLRQHGAQPSAIHHTAEFLSSHSVHASDAQPASPPRRGTTGASSNSHSHSNAHSATSSVSAILRDSPIHGTTAALTSGGLPSAAAAAPCISQSAAFEAMRLRMKAKHGQSSDSLSTSHTSSCDGPSLSLSALLAASPHPTAIHKPPSSVAVSAAPAVIPLTSVGSGASHSGAAVSALRARLAAIHAASRTYQPT